MNPLGAKRPRVDHVSGALPAAAAPAATHGKRRRVVAAAGGEGGGEWGGDDGSSDRDGLASVASVPVSLPPASTPLLWSGWSTGDEGEGPAAPVAAEHVSPRRRSAVDDWSVARAGRRRWGDGAGGGGGGGDADEDEDGLAVDVRRLSDGAHGEAAGGLLRVRGNSGFNPATSTGASRAPGRASSGALAARPLVSHPPLVEGGGIAPAAAAAAAGGLDDSMHGGRPTWADDGGGGGDGGSHGEPDAVTKRSLCAAAARRRLAQAHSPNDAAPSTHAPAAPPLWPAHAWLATAAASPPTPAAAPTSASLGAVPMTDDEDDDL
jgi:hypothetical protein